MANAATEQLVIALCNERVQARIMFTAYDITQAARRRGGNVRHNDVRDLVHELFENGRLGATYNRSLIEVGAPTKPWLYHHFGDDPANYREPGRDAPQQAAPAQPGLVQRIINTIFGSPPPNRAASVQGSAGQRAPGGSGQSANSNAGGGSQTQRPPARRVSTTLNLDASQFLPISRDELKQQAKGINVWGSPWFGRRDLIPPVTDKRTNLIDRAMVAQGLLSPEQLKDIHEVGAEMDRVRPDLLAVQHQVAQAGEAAVQAARAERAKLRQQKKDESAQRAQQKRETIAHRRATDITFLGCGVSGRLGDRTSNLMKLETHSLPVLSTPSELATALKLTVPQLRWLSFHSDVTSRIHYVHFTVPKRSGGIRTLSSPHRRLAAAQEWILSNILTKLPTESAAHGFVAGHSIVTNAQPHVGQDIVMNLDLEAFFPSITFPRVRSVFHRLGYSPSVATILALLCTECPRRQVTYDGQPYHVATGPRGLPQGACTSPALSNQVARKLDKRLMGLATKLELKYTRYADDLTISGSANLKERIGYVLARIRHIAQDEGFVVNEKKTRIQRRNTAQMVTGLVVNDRVSVARTEVRRIRAILHRARTEGLAAQNKQNHPNFPAWLQGMIAYIQMARPDLGGRLSNELEGLLRRS
jgi:RNA-directed DNA polymerase